MRLTDISLARAALPWISFEREPAGLRKPLTTRHTKHAASDDKGNPRGFPTPSRKIEFWSETFLDHGYPALPDFVEPPIGPVCAP